MMTLFVLISLLVVPGLSQLFPNHMKVFFNLSDGYYISDLGENIKEEMLDYQYAFLASEWKLSTERSEQGYNFMKCSLLETDDEGLFGPAHYLGGVNLFGEKDFATRTYRNIPPHNMVSISFDGLAIDKWEQADHFNVTLGNNVTFGPWYPAKTPGNAVQHCGSSLYNDLWSTYLMRFNHSSRTLEVNISLSLTNPVSQASFGLRNVKVVFSNATTETTSNYCPRARCFQNRNSFSSPQCEKGYFFDGAACQKCHESCSQCNSNNSASDCYSCSYGFSYNGSHCLKNIDSTCRYQNMKSRGTPCEKCKTDNVLTTLGNCVQRSTSPCSSSDEIFLNEQFYPICFKKCPSTAPFLLNNMTCFKGPCPTFTEDHSYASTDQHVCQMNKEVLKNKIYEYDRNVEKASCPSSNNLHIWDTGYKICERCPPNYYLYEDGSCKTTCDRLFNRVRAEGLITKCNNPCPNSNLYIMEDKSCKAECLPPLEIRDNIFCDAPITSEARVGNITVQLRQQEQWVNADNQKLEINKEEYVLKNTWAVFALDRSHALNYTVYNYEYFANCGCHEQVCGVHCHKGEFCANNHLNVTKGFTCWPGQEFVNYCWSAYKAGQKAYKAFPLHLISTVSVINYGGPTFEKDKKDTTINNRFGESQTYSWNAMVTGIKITSANKSELVFAESVYKVVAKDELEVYKLPPTITPNFNKPRECHYGKTVKLSVDLDSPAISPYGDLNFYNFAGLISDLKSLHALTQKNIMDSWGEFRNWGRDQTSMSVFDPCNLQVLTIHQDPTNHQYFVNLPYPFQRLIDDNIICIAILELVDKNEEEQRINLYEIKNSSDTWKPSNRFVGVLANDFIEEVKLRITKSVNVTNVTFPDTDTEINIEVDHMASPPRLIVSSDRYLRCRFYLSDDCFFDLELEEKNDFYDAEDISDCGNFYERAVYNCDGLKGYFHLPYQLVETPISGFFLDPPDDAEYFSYQLDHIPVDHNSWSPKGTWQFWTSRWSLAKTFYLFIFIVLIIALCVTIRWLIKKNKELLVFKMMNEEEDIRILTTGEAVLDTEDDNRKKKDKNPPVLTEKDSRKKRPTKPPIYF